jgi:UDP-N-acetylmuramoyl-tripeptide--D-alanyl-D-alanine ligase
VFEIGMNHAGEIEPLTKLVRPACGDHHHRRAGASGILPLDRGDRRRQGGNFRRLEPGGAAVLNRDNPQFARLRERPRSSASRASFRSASTQGRRAAAETSRCIRTCSTVQARILGADVTYKLGAPGRHVAMNSLAVLAAASLAGADLALAALRAREIKPAAGRGARITLACRRRQALLIDESYNANPASMRAALALLGQAAVGPRGRRIAVLGDMLELGPRRRAASRPGRAGQGQCVDLVFCCRPADAHLWEALPSERRGGYAESAAALESQVLARSAPATPSWSRARSARRWARSSRR